MNKYRTTKFGLCKPLYGDVKMKTMRTLFGTMAILGLITIAPAYSQDKKPAEVKKPAAAEKQQMEEITILVHGAMTTACAKELTTALNGHGIHATVKESATPEAIKTEVEKGADLSAAAKAVTEARTKDRTAHPPAMDLVLFGTMDKAAGEKAVKALENVKGIDHKQCKTEVAKGEFLVRLDGKEKVTADQIKKTLTDAGFSTSFVKPTKAAAKI